jgi:hypothetical protein
MRKLHKQWLDVLGPNVAGTESAKGSVPVSRYSRKKTTGCASGSNKGFTTNKYFVTKKQVALLLQ